jgi:hypothetical protein
LSLSISCSGRECRRENGQYKHVAKFSIFEDGHCKLLQSLVEDVPGLELHALWGQSTLTEANYVSTDVNDQGTKWYMINIKWI